MAIENAPYIAGLNTSIPANTSPRAEGAAQIRGSKTAIKNSFPNVDAPVTATAARMNAIFNNPSDIQVGMIVMWAESNTPAGWTDCNGETVNGYQTPNLEGMFPRGATTKLPVTATGGNDAPTLSEHVTVDGHKLGINELPKHTHEYVDRYYPEVKKSLTGEGAPERSIMSNDSGNTAGSNGTDSDNSSMLYTMGTSEATGSGNKHTHGLTDSKDKPFDNRPAFFSIRFICYVGE